MSRRDPLRVADYLAHITEAIARIKEYTSGMDFDAYSADRKTQDAVLRNFEKDDLPKFESAIARARATAPN